MNNEIFVMVFVRFKPSFCFFKSFVDEYIIDLDYDSKTALYYSTKSDYVKVRESVLNDPFYPITEIQLIRPKR